MLKLTTTKARKDFSAVVDAVYARSERIVFTLNGKSVAAIVPIADLEALEATEDKLDIEAINAALADPDNADTIPWADVKKRLGLE
jgi:prevent-host-death family protein